MPKAATKWLSNQPVLELEEQARGGHFWSVGTPMFSPHMRKKLQLAQDKLHPRTDKSRLSFIQGQMLVELPATGCEDGHGNKWL